MIRWFTGKNTIILYFLILFISILFAQEASAVKKHQFTNSEATSKKTSDFNFVAAGDFGCGGEAKKTIEAMSNVKPELVIALGDLAYEKNPTCWFDMVRAIENNSKFKISFGEHDVSRGNLTYNLYLRHYNLTKPYYSFDYKNVHFLAMATPKDTLIPYDNSSEQYQFVKDDLKSAHQNKSINWIIVYSFRPFYSSNTTHPGQEALRDIYHPLFDKYGVDIVLQAHNHNYQRTYPIIFNKQSPSKGIITNKNKENYSNVEGEIFQTVGTAGADLHNLTAQVPFIAEQFDDKHGFLNIDIKENGKKLISTFYENTLLNIEDLFTMTKK